MIKKLVPWSQELETGIEVVDQQHLEFFKNLNNFILRVKCGRDDSVQAAAEQLEYLCYYIMMHFNTEEGYMVKCDDAKYREHQAEHNHLVFQVRALSAQLKGGATAETVESLFALLSQWVYEHILTWDVEFAARYRAWEAEQNGETQGPT